MNRRLEPLRPMLRPIRRAVTVPLERPEVRAAWVAMRRAAYRIADGWERARGRTPTIRPLRRYEFDELAWEHPYYRGRWGYMSAAGRQEADLIRRHGIRTALELGPNLRSLTVGADVMVLAPDPELRHEGQVLTHDATRLPWPIADGRYDLFVALQVFEHLGDAQPRVFDEVRRVARNAIISLPIDWVMDDPTNCHHGITRERALAWFAPAVPTRVAVGNGGRRTRLIFVFEDLVPPAS